MIGQRGIICAFAAVAVGAMSMGTRADSILTMQPPNGAQKELVEWNPLITFNRTGGTGSGAVGSEAIGTFTITVTPSTTGTLVDSARYGLPGSATIYPFAPFSITGTLDIKNTSSGYVVSFGGPTQENIQGTAIASSTIHEFLTFNNSSDLADFKINLDGTTLDPLAFVFTRGTTNYYNADDDAYIVAQLKKIKTSTAADPNSDPLVGSDFFVMTGSSPTGTYTWDAGQYKMDVCRGTAAACPFIDVEYL